jgi:hypothetical protein
MVQIIFSSSGSHLTLLPSRYEIVAIEAVTASSNPLSTGQLGNLSL